MGTLLSSFPPFLLSTSPRKSGGNDEIETEQSGEGQTFLVQFQLTNLRTGVTYVSACPSTGASMPGWIGHRSNLKKKNQKIYNNSLFCLPSLGLSTTKIAQSYLEKQTLFCPFLSQTISLSKKKI